MTGEHDALEAFERLGLTSYEAKVLIALYRLGTGTARDVAQETDVPRSQVYSVAESLEDRGLLEVAEASPKRYRPIAVEEARRTLRERLAAERERAFEYVESIEAKERPEEEQEAIWTVRGSDRVDDRVAALIGEAANRVVLGAPNPALVPDLVREALEERAEAGVTVTCISDDDAVLAVFDDLEGVDAVPYAADYDGSERAGRFLTVDDDTILLSVLDGDGSETAIWSAGSVFASVLITLIEGTPARPEP